MPSHNAVVLNVRDFGAKGDGLTDDTTAIQAAINAAVNGRLKTVKFESGTFLCGEVTITGSVNIVGDGLRCTNIKASSGTTNVFVVTTPNPVTIRRLSINSYASDANQTAGAFIKFVANTERNANNVIDDIRLFRAYVGIDFEGCTYSAIRNSYIIRYVIGVKISNTNFPDSGDSLITGCVFHAEVNQSDTSSGTAIYQTSSGGLRISNCKVQHGEYAYRGVFRPTSATSICLIENNSFENQCKAAIAFEGSDEDTANDVCFSMPIISGNEIMTKTPNTTSENYTSVILIDGKGSRIRDAQISDNTIVLKSSYAVAINIIKADNCTVGHNVIKSEDYVGRVTCVTGIKIGNSTDNPSLHVYSQDFSNNFANNNSKCFDLVNNNGEEIEFDGISESGKVLSEIGTCEAMWGAGSSMYWSPAKTRNFSTPFPIVPHVVITQANGHSGFIGAVVTNTTTTGFTFRAISTTNQTLAKGYVFNFHAEV